MYNPTGGSGVAEQSALQGQQQHRSAETPPAPASMVAAAGSFHYGKLQQHHPARDSSSSSSSRHTPSDSAHQYRSQHPQYRHPEKPYRDRGDGGGGDEDEDMSVDEMILNTVDGAVDGEGEMDIEENGSVTYDAEGDADRDEDGPSSPEFPRPRKRSHHPHHSHSHHPQQEQIGSSQRLSPTAAFQQRQGQQQWARQQEQQFAPDARSASAPHLGFSHYGGNGHPNSHTSSNPNTSSLSALGGNGLSKAARNNSNQHGQVRTTSSHRAPQPLPLDSGGSGAASGPGSAGGGSEMMDVKLSLEWREAQGRGDGEQQPRASMSPEFPARQRAGPNWGDQVSSTSGPGGNQLLPPTSSTTSSSSSGSSLSVSTGSAIGGRSPASASTITPGGMSMNMNNGSTAAPTPISPIDSHSFSATASRSENPHTPLSAPRYPAPPPPPSSSDHQHQQLLSRYQSAPSLGGRGLSSALAPPPSHSHHLPHNLSTESFASSTTSARPGASASGKAVGGPDRPHHPRRGAVPLAERHCSQCGKPGRFKDGRSVEKWGPGPDGPGTVCDKSVSSLLFFSFSFLVFCVSLCGKGNRTILYVRAAKK